MVELARNKSQKLHRRREHSRAGGCIWFCTRCLLAPAGIKLVPGICWWLHLVLYPVPAGSWLHLVLYMVPDGCWLHLVLCPVPAGPGCIWLVLGACFLLVAPFGAAPGACRLLTAGCIWY
eukprot:scaffold5628_cov15-Tisochrysis_lutea.AAC.1